MSPVKKPTVKLNLPVNEEKVRDCIFRSYKLMTTQKINIL